MSELSGKYREKIEKLAKYIFGLMDGIKGTELLDKYQIQEYMFTPQEVLIALDMVVNSGADMEKIKTATNKLFNILYKNLQSSEKQHYTQISFIGFLVQDNNGIRQHLARSRHLIKKINEKQNPEIIGILKDSFLEMLRFTEHYVVMQNIVFPEIESRTENHGCLKILWSFHDDIIRNIKLTIKSLNEPVFDLRQFNKTCGKVYFNINTIIFREENVLFPVMYKIFEERVYTKMQRQLIDFRLEYFNTSNIETDNRLNENGIRNILNVPLEFSTGKLNLEQIELIINQLPIDITFVDENDEVKFYSDPEHRIFPRTKGIIGRKVQNCHPRESVHIVNQIVDAFKKGEKNEASFWVRIGEKYVLIKYFAIRDKHHKYKGILEVSQEISEIQKIKGEKKLLDWQ